MYIFLSTAAWLLSVGTHALLLRSEPESSIERRTFHEPSGRTHDECSGTGTLFVHFGLGAHGGESLDVFFRRNNFSTGFYNRAGLLWERIAHDLRAGRDHLPQIRRLAADLRRRNRCGNVFLGDIKPQKIIGDMGAVGAGKSYPTYQQLFQSLDLAFPDAVWIWLIRHPDSWAASLTSWAHPQDQQQADEHLQNARRVHAHFHCKTAEYFGDRTLGRPNGNGQSNGTLPGSVVQLNLEQMDWQVFVKQLQDASGYHGLSAGEDMPHVGHHGSFHGPSWEYTVPDTQNWNSWGYLQDVCPHSAAFQIKAMKSSPWDDEEDKGW